MLINSFIVTLCEPCSEANTVEETSSIVLQLKIYVGLLQHIDLYSLQFRIREVFKEVEYWN